MKTSARKSSEEIVRSNRASKSSIGTVEVRSAEHPANGRKSFEVEDTPHVAEPSSTPATDAPPDGGVRAWTQAVLAHLVVFNTWGGIISFGFFQTYYATTLGRPPSDISWVGSVQIFFLLFIGTVSGRALDGGYFHLVSAVGEILLVFGIFMTSICQKYWQLFLAQGICIGIANGLLFCPTMALVATYFSKRRGFALAIASTGTATGGLVFPAIAEYLLPLIDFGWTVRVMGFITMASAAVSLAFLRPRLRPRVAGPLIDWEAFKEAPYVLYCVGSFLIFMALFFANYYVGAYGRNIIGISFHDSVALLMVMNGVGIPGRLIPNYLADRYFGALNLMIPFAAVAGIIMFAWAGVRSVCGLWAFSALYGLVGTGTQCLFTAALSSLTTDLSKAGVRMGMCLSIISFACLTGPPLAGVLIQRRDGDYLYAQMWAGTVLVCGALVTAVGRVAKVGFSLRRKV